MDKIWRDIISLHILSLEAPGYGGETPIRAPEHPVLDLKN